MDLFSFAGILIGGSWNTLEHTSLYTRLGLRELVYLISKSFTCQRLIVWGNLAKYSRKIRWDFESVEATRGTAGKLAELNAEHKLGANLWEKVEINFSRITRSEMTTTVPDASSAGSQHKHKHTDWPEFYHPVE